MSKHDTDLSKFNNDEIKKEFLERYKEGKIKWKNAYTNSNKGNLICLWNSIREFNNFGEMYYYILKILKQNNLYVEKLKSSEFEWYNIQFINLCDDDVDIMRYPYILRRDLNKWKL